MMLADPAMTRPSTRTTGTARCPESRMIGSMWKPGRYERRRCAARFQSNAQRAFSLKCENSNWKSSGIMRPEVLARRRPHRKDRALGVRAPRVRARPSEASRGGGSTRLCRVEEGDRVPLYKQAGETDRPPS